MSKEKETNARVSFKNVDEVKEYLETIIALMPGHVYWKDETGVLLGCNDQQAKSAGLSSRKEIVGKTDYDMPWKEQADNLRKIDQEVIRTGKPKTIEEGSTLVDGTESIFLSKKVPHYYEGKIVGIVGISFDITEQKKAEKELWKLNHRRLEGMTIVSGSIAHELRTPLAALSLEVETLEESLPVLLKSYQLAKKANFPIPELDTERLQHLTKIPGSMEFEIRSAFTFIDILLMNLQSSVSAGANELFSIANCVNEALSRYPFQSGQKEFIHTDLTDDFKVNGKIMLVVHVFFNLLKNALYYIAAASKGEITISLKRSQHYNKVYFKDTGAGIPKSILPKIFHRFFSKTYHGAGIGLTYCKMVMKALGGDISCESIEGEYTLFILNFPSSKKLDSK